MMRWNDSSALNSQPIAIQSLNIKLSAVIQICGISITSSFCVWVHNQTVKESFEPGLLPTKVIEGLKAFQAIKAR